MKTSLSMPILPNYQAFVNPLFTDKFLGAAERVIFNFLRGKANFVSPFAIHNPEGWYYWFMHFANRVRARQVYNGVLHKNSGQQAHFGTGGLRMHSCNPADGGLLYTFDALSTEKSFPQLVDDVAKRRPKRYHYDSHKQLETHLADSINAYNYGRRLKILKGLTPYEYICKIWKSEPKRFTLNPLHQMPGLNTQIIGL